MNNISFLLFITTTAMEDYRGDVTGRPLTGKLRLPHNTHDNFKTVGHNEGVYRNIENFVKTNTDSKTIKPISNLTTSIDEQVESRRSIRDSIKTAIEIYNNISKDNSDKDTSSEDGVTSATFFGFIQNILKKTNQSLRRTFSTITNSTDGINTSSGSVRSNSKIHDLKLWVDENPGEDNWNNNTRRVYNGAEVSIKKYPFMVSLHIVGDFVCAGVIISKTAVITAASCMHVAFPDKKFQGGIVKLRVGSDFTSSDGDLIPIIDIFFHPNYDPVYLKHNLAIASIETRLKFNHYNKLKRIDYDRVPNNLPLGNPIMILGWGDKDHYEKYEGQLSLARLEVYELETCKKTYWQNYVNDRNFCAGLANVGSGACYRDIGGPGILGSKMVGIISFGPPECGTTDAPTVFTQLGHYYDWIASVLENMETTAQAEREMVEASAQAEREMMEANAQAEHMLQTNEQAARQMQLEENALEEHRLIYSTLAAELETAAVRPTVPTNLFNDMIRELTLAYAPVNPDKILETETLGYPTTIPYSTQIANFDYEYKEEGPILTKILEQLNDNGDGNNDDEMHSEEGNYIPIPLRPNPAPLIKDMDEVKKEINSQDGNYDSKYALRPVPTIKDMYGVKKEINYGPKYALRPVPTPLIKEIDGVKKDINYGPKYALRPVPTPLIKDIDGVKKLMKPMGYNVVPYEKKPLNLREIRQLLTRTAETTTIGDVIDSFSLENDKYYEPDRQVIAGPLSGGNNNMVNENKHRYLLLNSANATHTGKQVGSLNNNIYLSGLGKREHIRTENNNVGRTGSYVLQTRLITNKLTKGPSVENSKKKPQQASQYDYSQLLGVGKDKVFASELSREYEEAFNDVETKSHRRSIFEYLII